MDTMAKNRGAGDEPKVGIFWYNATRKELFGVVTHKRTDYLQKACDIMLRHKDPETICGTVRNIGREGESYAVMTLKELRDTKVDMFTTVFIGNGQTRNIEGRMVTPRGYKHD